MTLEGLLASAKQVIGEEGWTGVHDGTIEAAVKASYPKFAKGYQDAFMEFLVSALFREGYGGHLNPRQCAIAYSANEGERSLGGRYKGCEAANPVDARYAKIINESKNPGFATGSLANTSNLCRPPADKGDPGGHKKHRPNYASCATKGDSIGERPSAT